MLRVSSGKLKNKKLEVHKSVTRPLTERIRISIFDLLTDFLPDAKFLDLYAGSGAVGIEAISRGAKHVTFVDQNSDVVEIIKKNIKSCEIENQTKVIRSHILNYIKHSGGFEKKKENDKENLENKNETFDIVFADPPFNDYSSFILDKLAKVLDKEGIIALRISVEYFKKYPGQFKSSHLEKVYEKRMGNSQLIFYRK